MARTKQKSRQKEPAPLKLTPRLPSGRSIGQSASVASRQCSRSTSNKSSGSTTSGTLKQSSTSRPNLSPKKNETIFDILQLGESLNNSKDVKEMLSLQKMGYVNQSRRSTRLYELENRFVHNALRGVEHCRHEIIDVYGDGNCLFYCLLLQLKLLGRPILKNSDCYNDVVKSFRKSLRDQYKKFYDGNINMWKAELNFFITSEEGREEMKTYHRYTDCQIDDAVRSRMLKHELDKELRKVWKGRKLYVKDTPEKNFQEIDDGKIPALEPPDGHFVARLFTSIFYCQLSM